MSEAALSRILNLIKVEDDLSKIETLRQQFQKEKASIDHQLNTATEQQIASLVTSIEHLNVAKDSISSIRGNIERINTVFDESITNVKDYDTIKDVSLMYQTMLQVQNLYTDIANFKQYLDHVHNMIESELTAVSEDLSYPMFNLYRIHFNVTQARNLLEYLESQALTLSDDVQSIVAKIILPIRKIIRSFDELITEVAMSVTEAVKEGNSKMVDVIVRVIEIEAAEDLKASLISDLGLQDPANVSTDDYSKFRAKPRHYKKFFYSKFEQSLTDTFDKCVEHFSHDKLLVYDNLDWLEEELLFVDATLSKVFPDYWNIGEFTNGVYHKKLHHFTMELIKTNPPAEDLMQILAYDQHYSKLVQSLDFGDKKDKSILGETLKASVLEDYMKVIVVKMEEWNKTLIEREDRAFVDRSEPPELFSYVQTLEDLDDEENPISLEVVADVYVLPNFNVTLSMLKEQADVAADSGYGLVLVKVIENWSKCYLERIAAYTAVVELEWDKYIQAYGNEKYLIKESMTRRFLNLQKTKEPEIDWDNLTPEELSKYSSQGFIEYLAALSNTFEINAERLLERIVPEYASKVHSSYLVAIERAVEQTLEPSALLNGLAIRTIADIIVNDLYPALSELFTKSWYENDRATSDFIMAQVIADTMAELLEELKGYSSVEMFSLLFGIMFDKFVGAYLRIGYQNILHGSGKKIDPTSRKKGTLFADAVHRDVDIFFASLSPLLSRKDANYLMKSLLALEILVTIATCENPLDEVVAIWLGEILDAYYDASVEYVKGALLCRKDVESKRVPPVIAKLEQIKTEHHQNTDRPAAVPSTLTNFDYEQKV